MAFFWRIFLIFLFLTVLIQACDCGPKTKVPKEGNSSESEKLTPIEIPSEALDSMCPLKWLNRYEQNREIDRSGWNVSLGGKGEASLKGIFKYFSDMKISAQADGGYEEFQTFVQDLGNEYSQKFIEKHVDIYQCFCPEFYFRAKRSKELDAAFYEEIIRVFKECRGEKEPEQKVKEEKEDEEQIPKEERTRTKKTTPKEEASTRIDQPDDQSKPTEKTTSCKIYGTIKDGSTPLEGVSVFFEGEKVATTNETGIYKATLLVPGKRSPGDLLAITFIKEGYKEGNFGFSCGQEGKNISLTKLK